MIEEDQVEWGPAVGALQTPQVLDVVVAEVEALDVLHGEGETAGHGEAAAEGVPAKREVKRRLLRRRALLPVGIGHGELIEVVDERQRVLVDAVENAQIGLL